MPKVAINAGSFPFAISRPVISPQRAPVHSAMIKAKIRGIPALRHTANIIPTKDRTLPAERSTPSVMMQNVIPTANIPVSAICVIIADKFVIEKK